MTPIPDRAAIDRDFTLLTILERQAALNEQLAAGLAGLDRLDDERKGDIDELREEVAALGAITDALRNEVAALGAKADRPMALHSDEAL